MSLRCRCSLVTGSAPASESVSRVRVSAEPGPEPSGPGLSPGCGAECRAAELGEAFGLRAVLLPPGPQPRGGEPQPVLLRGPDRAVQLVRDRGHDACAAAGLRLRRH